MLSQERASTFRLGLHEKRTEQNINRKRTFKKQTEMSASAQFILVFIACVCQFLSILYFRFIQNS